MIDWPESSENEKRHYFVDSIIRGNVAIIRLGGSDSFRMFITSIIEGSDGRI